MADVIFVQTARATLIDLVDTYSEITNLRRRPPLDGEPSSEAGTSGAAAAGITATGTTAAAAGAKTAGLAADSTGRAATAMAAAGPINSARSASFGDCGMTRPLPRLLLFPGDLLALR